MEDIGAKWDSVCPPIHLSLEEGQQVSMLGEENGLKKKKKLGWKLQQNNCLSPSKEEIVEHIR